MLFKSYTLDVFLKTINLINITIQIFLIIENSYWTCKLFLHSVRFIFKKDTINSFTIYNYIEKTILIESWIIF